MMCMPAFKRSSFAAALLCFAVGQPARSQEASTEAPSPAGDAGTAASAQGQGIEEIVVTSQHREEKLKDIPIAITAATAEQMQAQGVSDAFDIGKLTPGFSTNRVVGFGAPFMRGVGTTSVLAGDEPSVATYVDGFYQGLSVATQLPFNNVERVEVLKGPQGTLYGRNAVGGLVSIVTRKPSATPTLEGSVGYSNYDTKAGNVYMTTGLSDDVAVDLAVTAQDQGKGFSRNLVDGKRYGTNDYVSARSKLLFNFGESNSLLIGGEYTNSKNNLANVNSPAPGTLPLEHEAGVVYGQDRDEFAANIDPKFDVEQYGVNATLNLDVGFATFVSLSQYRRVEANYHVEGDGTSSDGVLATQQEAIRRDQNGNPVAVNETVVPASFFYTSKQSIPRFITQEFQLVSKDPGPFKWITGTYLQSSQDGYDPLNLYFSTQAPPIAIIDRNQKTLALAAFAQGSYTLDSGVTLTQGIRYSGEKKSIDGTVSQLNPQGGYDVYGTGPEGEQSHWFKSFTFRSAIDYHVSDALMVYGTVNKGFKSGIYNEQNIGAPPVKPETLYAYEAGFKATPGWLRLDGSVYYYDYRDLQTFVVGTDGLTHLQNAGGAEMYGAELTAEVSPTRGLTLRGGIGLEKAEYTDFEDAEVFVPSTSGGNYSTAQDVTGNDVIRTPKATGNLGVSYLFDVGSAGNVTLNGSLAYSGKFAWDQGNLFHQDAYTLVDLSVRYATPDDRWNLTLWGKNVTDEKYFVYRNITQRFDSVAWGNPATYGLTLGYRF